METVINFAKLGARVAGFNIVLSLTKDAGKISRKLSYRNLMVLRQMSNEPSSAQNIKNLFVTQENPSQYTTRTHTCGELTRKNVGETVCLKGWIQYNRHKFLVIRDAYGTVQILIEDLREDLRKVIDSLTLESVIEVRGEVHPRPDEQINHEMSTGEVEVKATDLMVLSSAPSTLPLYIRKTKMPTEHLRMKYRYLYLRYPHMQKMLRVRSKLIHAMREFFMQRHFVDVETPTLFRKTPGGAQEFVVPTQNPGHVYSLAQSPQQFKQLLMVGGLDRYFQVARCYRDETIRYDRQPEFTQLDVELSFVDREGIILLIEELLECCCPHDLMKISVPFPRMTYSDVMQNYGSDKPDLRFSAKIQNVSHLVNLKNLSETKFFMENSKHLKLSARAMIFPQAADVCSKMQLSDVVKEALSQANANSTQLLLAPIKKELWVSPLRKVLPADELKSIQEELKPNKGDLVVMSLGPDDEAVKVLGLARGLTADALEATGFSVRDKCPSFLWVIDFPLFERNDSGSLVPAHHPFTQPHPSDVHLLDTDPLKVRGLHYDLVLNGCEIGGGSIRISDAQLQRYILHDMLHLDTNDFQHLLDALSFGCPPHGGIALGLDRLISIICGVKSIREVIAFPKALEGKDPMVGAPAPLTDEDAKIYKLPLSSKS